MSRYRCRNHPDNETNWRGAGCPDCQAHDAERAVRLRAERRHRARLADEREARRASA